MSKNRGFDEALFDWNSNNVGSYTIERVDARELLTSNRIDLVAKYKYVEMYDNAWNIPFVKELYKAHISAFSAGTFIEPGQEEKKKSIEDYETYFIQLIDDIKKNGFDEQISVIPVGGDNTILNGGHRVAIAAYYGIKVPIVHVSDRIDKYGIDFFNNRLLDKKYLNYLLSEYIKLKDNIYVGVVWPAADAGKLSQAFTILNQQGNLICYDEVELTYQGLFNLMSNIYGHQSWAGSIDDGFRGIYGKVDSCYKENTKTHVFFLENASLEEVQQLKSNIREEFGIGNHSVHICDTHEEAVQMARLLLNENSVHALNNAQICKENQYIKKVHQFKALLDSLNVDCETVLIDSSGVLGLYGLRTPSDIDYLSLYGQELSDASAGIQIDPYDRMLSFHGKAKEELLLDPSNYLWGYDMKFLSLPELYSMKNNRGESRDKEDCALINSIYDTSSVRRIINRSVAMVRRKMRYLRCRIVSKLLSFLKVTGLYSSVRKVYRFIKGKNNG